MAFLKKEFLDRIYDRVNDDAELLLQVVREVAGEPKEYGHGETKFVCPHCNAGALTVSKKKMIYKCFSCNEVSGRNAINFLMGPGSKLSLQEAVENVCQHYGILPEYEEQRKPAVRRKKEQPKQDAAADAATVTEDGSFCRQMLDGSGLTREDVTAHVRMRIGDSEFLETPTFQKGTVNDRYEIDKSGNDVIIYYYDLDGNPCTYTYTPKGRKPIERTYYRIRYEFPDAHKDISGTPVKYRSPKGSPTFIYYPEAIRKEYREKNTIDTLYIQEGEKKAEKACKHGIPSVAISGIQNLGGPDKKLPQELIKLIRDCHVKKVVFLMDSDLHDLSKNLTETKPVNQRPSAFFTAVCKYKAYMNELVNQNIYVEVYYGHVTKNDAGDKGIDDLLTNTLRGKEETLAEDIRQAMNTQLLTGTYVQLYNITEVSTTKIKEQFYLTSAQVFCEHYKDQLKILREFVCMGWKYRFNEKDELVSASPVEPDEKFWEKDETRKGEPLKFVYTNAMTFLERRGFHVYERSDDNYFLVRVENGVVKAVAPRKVSNFIHEFTKAYLTKDVRELLLRGGTQYVGPYQLEQLEPFKGVFFEATRGLDYLFFRDIAWKITEHSVKEVPLSEIKFNIWSDSIHEFSGMKLLGPLVEVEKLPSEDYSIKLTQAGQRCHFLQFLVNASNFTWRKKQKELTEDDVASNTQHLVSKLSAIGYLANSYKDMGQAKAVIAMDGKLQDFDEANGRTGKSLVGLALRQIFPRAKVLDGKALGVSNNNRQFIWEGLDERSRIVIGDDLMKDFDFDSLFSLITSDWPVNPKGQAAYTVPFSKAPKIYLSSNFSVAGDGSSYRARQWPLAFSDFYSEDHQPVQDFGALFFEEWDSDQWELFWNLIAQCIQIYFRFGYVPAPDSRLEDRRLIQQIGEDFMTWADEYFEVGGGHLNIRILRQEMFRAFTEHVQNTRGTKVPYSPKGFSMRLGYYVRLKKYFLNPHLYNPKTKTWNTCDKDGKPVKTDKSNGKEFYTIGAPDYYETHIFSDGTPAPPELSIQFADDNDTETWEK